jgi:hypothetical protein
MGCDDGWEQLDVWVPSVVTFLSIERGRLVGRDRRQADHLTASQRFQYSLANSYSCST